MRTVLINAYSVLIGRIGCVSIHIDNKKKRIITYLMIFILGILGIIRPFKFSLKDIIHYTDSAAIITGSIALLVLLIAATDIFKDYKRIITYKACLYGWMLCSLMIFIMSFINPVRTGYFAWGIVGLFISVPFVMVWAARDDFSLFCTVLSRAMTAAAGCFIIINLLIAPLIKPLSACYSGLMGNPNGNGMICVGLYAASFFLLLTEEKGALGFSVITGFLIALSYVSVCRAAQLAIALQSVAGLVYYLKVLKNKGRTLNINRIILTCSVIVIAAIVSGYILTEIGKMDLNVYAYNGAGAVTSEDKINELLYTLDLKSSGRVHIWRAFIAKATFWGNGSPDAPLIPGYEASLYAHNNAIEILYTSGVIAFIGYVLFLISGISFVVQCLAGKNGYKKEYILVIMAFTGYFVEAMLEIVMYPMCHMPAILLNLCMMPIFISHNKNSDIKQEPKVIE